MPRQALNKHRLYDCRGAKAGGCRFATYVLNGQSNDNHMPSHNHAMQPLHHAHRTRALRHIHPPATAPAPALLALPALPHRTHAHAPRHARTARCRGRCGGPSPAPPPSRRWTPPPGRSTPRCPPSWTRSRCMSRVRRCPPDVQLAGTDPRRHRLPQVRHGIVLHLAWHWMLHLLFLHLLCLTSLGSSIFWGAGGGAHVKYLATRSVSEINALCANPDCV